MNALKVLVLSLSASVVSADHWAVIAAGSSGFGNYRHQADACHAYQIVKANGVPEENIIMMMADDVANSGSNPFPGKLYNHPTNAGDPVVDVYSGCNIDYSGSDVTAELFLNVLTGKSSEVQGLGNGKVLKSTAEDNVFVYFVDHGGAGLICFPSGPYLYADQLNDALKTMHSQNMYKKMVFYLEACESGSMFDGSLDSSLNIYATTAANGEESSYATYCYPDDLADGQHVGSCLGDEYSVNWMEDSELGDNEHSESLAQQLSSVTTATVQSHVQQFGSTDFEDDKLDQYQGSGSANAANSTGVATPSEFSTSASAVDARDVGLYQMYARASAAADAGDEESAGRLLAEAQAEEAAREVEAKLLKGVVAELVGEEKRDEMMGVRPFSWESFPCYRQANDAVQAACGAYSEAGLKLARGVLNLCEEGFSVVEISEVAQSVCGAAEQL